MYSYYVCFSSISLINKIIDSKFLSSIIFSLIIFSPDFPSFLGHLNCALLSNKSFHFEFDLASIKQLKIELFSA